MAKSKKSAAWRDYQEKAAELLRRMGFSAVVEETLEGARGTHAVDVVARTTLGGVEVTWIIECKYWKTAIPKAHVLTLAGIAQDTGADRAVLLSEKGFQAGAINVSRKSNVLLTSLEELSATAGDSIAELSIRRTLLRVKELEQELRDILFDNGPRNPIEPDIDEVITLLGACLEVTLAVVAAQTARFPVRLPAMFSDQSRYADDLPAVADGLASDLEEIAKRHAAVKSNIAVSLQPYAQSATHLIGYVRDFMGKAAVLLSPSMKGEVEEAQLLAILKAMQSVGDCADNLRSIPSAALSRPMNTLMRELIDGAYLWIADPERTEETWNELNTRTDVAVEKLAQAVAGEHIDPA
jgi:hypothetical protein